ncbi:PilZ domain-containing protein [Aeromonas simiae]|uniref:PilZ domain-containing protein n=1 Tax=Aeromonas simiae TaxID=218936 RepID=A0A5J6WU82_9GAMM|nr:PilZ domain-containing protein [Aeromonas simiae]QFI53438.1 PilZ domain-containing protein [Aeromonas simiae]
MITTTKERRAFQRMIINAPVTLHQGALRQVGICRDLSANGMGIFIEESGLDESLPLSVSLATGSNLLPPFEAQARIIRIGEEAGGYQVAVEFVSVA